MCQEVRGQCAGTRCEEGYDRRLELSSRGPLEVSWEREDVRRDGRCGERGTEVLLEVYRVVQDLRRELVDR